MPDLPIEGWIPARSGQQLQVLPGQFYFGHEAHQVCTLLGSCVGIAVWHPARRLGGLCHFLLPSRQRSEQARPDGRFGDEAIGCLLQQMARHGTTPPEYRTFLCGGADTMPDHAGVKFNVGQRNIELAWQLLDRHGFNLLEVDVGDHMPRHLQLDLRRGHVVMRRSASHAPTLTVPPVRPPARVVSQLSSCP